MDKIEKIIRICLENPKGVRFSDLSKICEFFFGTPRQSASSHIVFRTPWVGDPRINIQNKKGMAKAYQVKQVLKAIEKIKGGGYE